MTQIKDSNKFRQSILLHADRIDQKQCVPFGHLTFQGKIGSVDQHMFQKLIFFVWLFTCVKRNFYSSRQQGPEDIQTHQATFSICQLLLWEGLKAQIIHRHTQLVLGLKLISLETLRFERKMLSW